MWNSRVGQLTLSTLGRKRCISKPVIEFFVYSLDHELGIQIRGAIVSESLQDLTPQCVRQWETRLQ